MSKRIVLVDPLGDVLFSGVSVAQSTAPPPETAPAAVVEDEIEECPATLRSPTHDSGVFPIVKAIRVHTHRNGEHAA